MHLAVMPILGTKGDVGDGILDVLQSTTSTSSSSILLVVTLPQFLDQWSNITFNRFVFIIVKHHHLWLSCHSKLFYNFKWFNFNGATANYLSIQEEVVELLTKCATDPYTVGAGISLNAFAVPICTSGS